MMLEDLLVRDVEDLSVQRHPDICLPRKKAGSLLICIGYQECLGHKSKICVGRYSSVFIFLYYLFFIAEKHIQILCFNGYVAQ